MALVAEIIPTGPDTGEAVDSVVREAEDLIVRALFDDLVRTLPPRRLSSLVAPRPAIRPEYPVPAETWPARPRSDRLVDPWARSPPGAD